MSLLGTFAVELGLMELSKMANDVKSLKPADATNLANQIISAAEKKGAAALNRANEIIMSIPQLSGSPAVKDSLIKARQRAQSHYNKVEQKVMDMKQKASNAANELQSMSDRSMLGTVWDDIKTGTTQKERAQNLADNTFNQIQNYDLNVEKEI